MRGVGPGDGGRIKILTDDALGRAGFLNLRDHRCLFGGNFCPDGADEVARCRLLPGQRFHVGQRMPGVAGFNFGFFGGDDFGEDVARVV